MLVGRNVTLGAGARRVSLLGAVPGWLLRDDAPCLPSAPPHGSTVSLETARDRRPIQVRRAALRELCRNVDSGFRRTLACQASEGPSPNATSFDMYVWLCS